MIRLSKQRERLKRTLLCVKHIYEEKNDGAFFTHVSFRNIIL